MPCIFSCSKCPTLVTGAARRNWRMPRPMPTPTPKVRRPSKKASGAKHQALTSDKSASSQVLTSLALLVGRWGHWPAWTPLLLRTLAANPTVAFYMLSDVTPAPKLPDNVRHISLTLPQLLARLRRTVGVRLKSLTASGTYGSGVSSAKTNDFKPMFGAAFADLLSGYAWWGYLQEDLLVGDLRAFATEALLARSDVICPYIFPLNASGVLMLYRNTQKVNWLWNTSADMPRVLSSKAYTVFDEWWGPLEGRQNLAHVLGRAAARGEIRLSLSPTRRKWMADDKRYGPGAAVQTNKDFVACWSHGVLWGNAQGAAHPCNTLGMARSARLTRRRNATAIASASDVAVVHISRLKRNPYLASLDLSTVRNTVARARTFALTAHGVWLPEAACEDDSTWRNRYGLGCAGYEAEGHCADSGFVRGREWAGGAAYQWPERHCCACGRPSRGLSATSAVARSEEGGVRSPHDDMTQHVWASGLLSSGAVVRVPSGKVAQHLRALEASDAAARCTLSSRRAARNGGAGCARLVAAAEGDATAAALPCVPTNGAGEAEAAARALGTRRC